MLFFKFFLSIFPILSLIIALTILKWQGYQAGIASLIVAASLSFFYFKLPAIHIITAILEGVLNGLWPISLVIIAALFTYHLVDETGAMEQIRQILGGISRDKRILTLIIGWGFGNFMEGMAGFGTAVAIPASILSGVGVDPFLAVLACLAVNTTPTAFGSVGIPVSTLANITNLPLETLCENVTFIQLILTFLSPFLLVFISGGEGFQKKEKRKNVFQGVIGITVVASLSFLIPWIVVAKLLGPELPNIIGSIVSMISMIFMAKIFYKETDSDYAISFKTMKKDDVSSLESEKTSWIKAFKAFSPFFFIFLLLIGTSKLFPTIYNALSVIETSLRVYTGEGANTLHFNWLHTPGVIILAAAFLGGFVQGVSFFAMIRILWSTVKKYTKTVITICSVLSIAKVMSYSGMVSHIANFLVIIIGPFYPLIAPVIGALGGFMTGSGTSTNVLFGNLQVETAKSLALNPVWMAAANVMGAGIGKMICPQSIAIGASAIGKNGLESKILKAIFPYFIFALILAGAVCFVGSFLKI